MSLLDDVSIVVTPNGYKAGELYAVVPTDVLGTEKIPDGTFSNGFNNWTTGANWSVLNNVATLASSDSPTTSLLTSDGSLDASKSYSFTYTILNYISGGLALVTGNLPITSTNGTHTYIFTNQTSLSIKRFGGASALSISNISVKENIGADMDVTRATAATRVDENGLVNYAEVLGSEQVPSIVSIVNLGGGTITQISGNSFSSSSDGTTGSSIRPKFDLATTSGKSYKLTITPTGVISGTVKFKFYDGSSYIFENYDFTTTKEIYFVDNGSVFGTFNGTETYNVASFTLSVKEVTRDNVPRIDYTGGGCPHILAEPQRTNLVTYSEDLSQWTLTNGTLTPNATVSPDGTQNAGKVVFNNTGVDLKRTITVVAGQTYTISFYIKLESGTGLDGRFYDNSNGANIDVYDYTSQIQGTEWSRITRSVTAPSGCTEMQIWLLASSSSLVTAFFWGAQFELGSYPTSLIPTSGSTVTRNQDVFSRDGISSLINSTEGVLFAEIAALANDGTIRYLSINDGSSNNRVALFYYSSSNNIRVIVSSGGTNYMDKNSSVSSILDFHKVAIKWKVDDFSLWIDGSKVQTDISGLVPIGLNTLSLDVAGSDNFFGKVKQLQVYKTALTDVQLAALTS